MNGLDTNRSLQPYKVEIPVPQDKIGLVIGKKGCNIKLIQRRSGVFDATVQGNSLIVRCESSKVGDEVRNFVDYRIKNALIRDTTRKNRRGQICAVLDAPPSTHHFSFTDKKSEFVTDDLLMKHPSFLIFHNSSAGEYEIDLQKMQLNEIPNSGMFSELQKKKMMTVIVTELEGLLEKAKERNLDNEDLTLSYSVGKTYFEFLESPPRQLFSLEGEIRLPGANHYSPKLIQSELLHDVEAKLLTHGSYKLVDDNVRHTMTYQDCTNGKNFTIKLKEEPNVTIADPSSQRKVDAVKDALAWTKWWDILGLNESNKSKWKAIEDAYKKRQALLHPEVNSHPQAPIALARLDEAYSIALCVLGNKKVPKLSRAIACNEDSNIFFNTDNVEIFQDTYNNLCITLLRDADKADGRLKLVTAKKIAVDNRSRELLNELNKFRLEQDPDNNKLLSIPNGSFQESMSRRSNYRAYFNGVDTVIVSRVTMRVKPAKQHNHLEIVVRNKAIPEKIAKVILTSTDSVDRENERNIMLRNLAGEVIEWMRSTRELMDFLLNM
eukprot:CFRG6080T1